MANLTGNPTTFGENLYTNNLLANIQKFVLIGSDTLVDDTLSGKLSGLDLTYEEIEDAVLAELPIPHAGHDSNNQAYFDCLVPYDLNLEKYIFAIGLVYDDNGTKRLADWAVVNKLYQTTQVGGTYKYMVAVTSENGGVIFKNTDFVTSSELDDTLSKEIAKIETSPIVSPKSENISIESGKITIDGYATSGTFSGNIENIIVQISQDNFQKIVKEDTLNVDTLPFEYVPTGLDASTAYQVRFAFASGDFRSIFSNTMTFSTSDMWIETPQVLIQNAQDAATQNLEITLSDFTPVNFTETHVSTDYRIKRNGVIVWQSVENATDKISIVVPISLNASTAYTVEAVFNGQTLSSAIGSLEIVTTSSTASPTLSTQNIILNEATSKNLTILNFDESFTYEILNGTHSTATRAGNTITVTANNVDVDSTDSIKVRATQNGLATSVWTEISVQILNVPIVEDGLIVYNAASMDEFTDLTNASIQNGVLVATADGAVAISNKIQQEVNESDFVALDNVIIKSSSKNINNGESVADKLVVDGSILKDGDVIEVLDFSEVAITQSNIVDKNFYPDPITSFVKNEKELQATSYSIDNIGFTAYGKDILFSKDGKLLWLFSDGTVSKHQFKLEKGFDLSSVYHSSSLYLSSDNLFSGDFSIDGNKFYGLTNDRKIVEYSFSSSYDLGGIYGALKKEKNLISHNSSALVSGISLKVVGSKAYVLTEEEFGHQYVYQYDISEGLESSTIEHAYTVPSSIPLGKTKSIAINNDASKMYVLFSSSIYELDMDSHSLVYNGQNISMPYSMGYGIYLESEMLFTVSSDARIFSFSGKSSAFKYQEIDTSSSTNGVVPTVAYRKSSQSVQFDFGNGYISAIPKSETITLSGDEVVINKEFENVVDAVGGRTLKTKVLLGNEGDKMTELSATIMKKDA